MATSTSSKQAYWKKARENGKKWYEKVGVSVNKATNALGAEAFWPTSLDKESDKAAKILRSFCIDGFHSDKNRTTLDHIPPEVGHLVAQPYTRDLGDTTISPITTTKHYKSADSNPGHS